MGLYELKKTTSDEYMFNLKADNHEVILTSERYTRKASAENGINSVRTHGVSEGNFELRFSTDRKPYFVLKAANGEIIGRSQLYSSESAARHGIRSVAVNAPSSEVKDLG